MMKRVLIVDDAQFMLVMLSSLIEGEGHLVVDTAENGQEAVEKYQTYRPDLVLLNLTMPVMDGITALAEILDINPGAQVILTTSLGSADMVEKTLRGGATGFLLKPFRPDALFDVMKKAGERSPIQRRDIGKDMAMIKIISDENILSQSQINLIFEMGYSQGDISSQTTDLLKALGMTSPVKTAPAPMVQGEGAGSLQQLLEEVLKGQQEIIRLLKEKS